MGDIAIITSPETPNLVIMHIDISELMQTFKDAKRAIEPEQRDTLMQRHHAIHRKIATQLQGVNGSNWWRKVIDAMTLHLQEPQATIVKTCPISTYMGNNFIKILKNVIDEAILGDLSPIQLEITTNIDLKLGLISMTFQDTGRGYPAHFLDRMLNDEKRYLYTRGQGGSHKYASSGNDHPHLFGGRALGLRRIITNLDYGAELVAPGHRKRTYEKSTTSVLQFSNRTDRSGACMHMITNITPLVRAERNPQAKATPALFKPNTHPQQTSDSPYSKGKKRPQLHLSTSPNAFSPQSDFTPLKSVSPVKKTGRFESPSKKTDYSSAEDIQHKLTEYFSSPSKK